MSDAVQDEGPDGADASPDESDEEVIEQADAEVTEPDDEESESDSPPDAEDNGDETTDEIKQRADALQGRIDKLTKNWRTTEREADDLRRQLDEANAKLAEADKEAPLKTLADFDHDEQAFTRYILDESEKRAERIARGLATKPAEPEVDEAASQYEAHAARERAFEEQNPDYRRKVYDDSVKISQVMALEIEASEIGPDMAYYLASNPDISSEIFGMSQRDAIREMARLEARLNSEKSSAKGNSVSKAPPPPSGRVKGIQPGTRVKADDPKSDKLSDEEWFKRREIDLAKKAG